MRVKKVIAIVLTVIYLGFTTGALIPADLDILSYEMLLDGRSNEKNEPEAAKCFETFHIHQTSKTWSRLKSQNVRVATASLKATAEDIFTTNRHYTSDNSYANIDHPLFLKNRVFRL